eukprot:EST49276.1 Hypothetical protein SS50377_10497 [Spironucleus salmonicida]
MQPFAISQPITPLTKDIECASSIIINNLADTPLLLKIQTSDSKLSSSPTIFTLLPNGRQRIQLLSKQLKSAQICVKGFFVESSEVILNEVAPELLKAFYNRFQDKAVSENTFVEQQMIIIYDDKQKYDQNKTSADDYNQKTKTLQNDVNFSQAALAEAQTQLQQKKILLAREQAEVTILENSEQSLKIQLKQKQRFKDFKGIGYRHLAAVLCFIFGFSTGLKLKSKLD